MLSSPLAPRVSVGARPWRIVRHDDSHALHRVRIPAAFLFTDGRGSGADGDAPNRNRYRGFRDGRSLVLPRGARTTRARGYICVTRVPALGGPGVPGTARICRRVVG